MKAVFEALAHHAVMRPGDVAFADGETSITWAELASRVAGAATVLRNGPRVVGLRLNGIPMVVAVWPQPLRVAAWCPCHGSSRPDRSSIFWPIRVQHC